MAHLRDLWAVLDMNDITLRVQYIRSALNPADHPSRIQPKDEWRLRRQIFESIRHPLCGTYTVDRFASCQTALLPRYNSEFSDPQAIAVNAMTQSWLTEVNWIHPPIDLLDVVAQKLTEQPAIATVVAPYWPHRSWFRSLKAICCSFETLPNANRQADPKHLLMFDRRGPGSWPLTYFHISPASVKQALSFPSCSGLQNP